jgi:hypothetical protein
MNWIRILLIAIAFCLAFIIYLVAKLYKVSEQLSKVNDFDYYYINQILIIPDPIPFSRLNWSKKVIINNLEKTTTESL